MTSGRSTLSLCTAIGTALVFVSSCTKAPKVPATDWHNLDSDSAKEWRVQTSDLIYRVQEFDMTDSTMILKRVSETLYYADDAYPPGPRHRDVTLQLPVTVPFDQIQSIERVGPSEGRTGLAAFGVVDIIAITTMLLIFVLGVGSMWGS